MKKNECMKTKRSKKIISLLLALTVGVAGVEVPQTIVYAENMSDIPQQETIQNVLEEYFDILLNTLLEDSSNDFTSEDFASINGYIVAKNLVATRECDKILLDGINMVNLKEVVIDDLTEKSDGVEAMTYVSYEYSWGSGTEENTSSVGTLYRVTLEKTGEAYTVSDLDNVDNVEIQMVKDAINISAYSVENIYQQADAYFDTLRQNAIDLSETTFDSVIVESDEEIVEPATTSVSYNTSKARNWGYKLGDDTQNYIFKRASEDCTNFASQCVWAGYGGADGYTIPSDPTVNDATCVALKNRVASDYRMTSTWYGRNYDSPYGDPPSEFCGVEAFCSYVTSNSGVGPKATVYNNNSVYSNLSVKMKAGDVLQFYSSSLGRYRHSVVVVSTTGYGVSDYTKVRVAQHSSDYNDRSLAELVESFGGSSCKMRLLRFKSTTY